MSKNYEIVEIYKEHDNDTICCMAGIDDNIYYIECSGKWITSSTAIQTSQDIKDCYSIAYIVDYCNNLIKRKGGTVNILARNTGKTITDDEIFLENI